MMSQDDIMEFDQLLGGIKRLPPCGRGSSAMKIVVTNPMALSPVDKVTANHSQRVFEVLAEPMTFIDGGEREYRWRIYAKFVV